MLPGLNMSKIKQLWTKKWFRRIVYVFSFFLILFLFRNPILRGIGNWLDASDPLIQTQACFILGGNSYERGKEGVDIYAQFPNQQFVCTGGNFPYQIRALLDTLMSEAELTRHIMQNKGVPTSKIEILEGSRSTMDESHEILAHCKSKGYTDITIVSSQFHMRRVKWVFDDLFEDAGITVHYHGANAEEYSIDNWWKTEEGLIMANNEVVKLFYYAVKY